MRIFTDGSGNTADKPSGWAIVAVDDLDEIVHTESGNNERMSSQQAELTAFIRAVEYIKEHDLKDAEIWTDSQYVERSINQDWLGQWKLDNFMYTKNVDYWKKINKFIYKDKIKFKTIWIRGHSGNLFNELADKLAGEARKELIATLKQQS